MEKRIDKATERALEAYPKETRDISGFVVDIGHPQYMRDLYIEGYHQAERDLLDNIWHSPDEEPEIDRKIIWESENFLGKHLDGEWKPMIDCFGRKERWCYLADILPSKNWTGERPYSKVDYSRGYDNGYEQAEKDLELTWKDMREIYCITLNLREHLGASVFGEPLYQEVLKLFKEWKEK